jgi:hypothetical protein
MKIETSSFSGFKIYPGHVRPPMTSLIQLGELTL